MRIWPRSLAGQLIAGILLALIVVHIITFAVFIDERRGAVQAASRTQVLQHAASVVRLVENAPAALIDQIVRDSSDPWIRFSVSNDSTAGTDDGGPSAWRLRNSFERFLDREDVEVRLDVYKAEGFPPLPFFGKWSGKNRDERRGWWRDDDDDDDWDHYRRHGKRHFRHPIGMTISVQLESGQWLNAETVVAPGRPAWAIPNLVMALSMGVVMIVVVIFLVRRATRPMAVLANTAERFGRGETVDAMAETGPSDVRQTIHAFNAMQGRLQRFVADRTQMLAAISHDLRTPLTSLRLRAEFIEDKELQRKILRTLEEMLAMTEATLAFAREDAQTEQSRIADMDALVESLCDDLAETGLEIVCQACSATAMPIRPAALRRALANLIQNAVAYGERARVFVTRAEDVLLISIEDDGPGISAENRERAFEPFVRLEASRSRDTGGIGLGLAITRTQIHAHGGEIILGEAESGGLRVDIRLPLPADD